MYFSERRAVRLGRNRNFRGQALTVPAIILAVMVVGAIGVFAFEIARTTSARDQLRTATEAAALAGATTLASFNEDDPADCHKQAIAAAKSVFVRNDLFGETFTATEGTGTPLPGKTLLEFTFIDPTTKQVVAFGDPKGKIMEITSRHGYTPLFASFFSSPMTTLPLSARASGGVGELDVALCFDCSSSMMVNTLASEVRRTWNPATGRIDYIVVRSGAHTGNGMRPQGIGVNAELRGVTDMGSPPGNFPPGVASDTGSTDVVVNVDENTTFGGFSEGGYDFPNVGALVEASRGNLDSAAMFTASHADSTLGGVVTPKAGYQAKYFELARKHTHPFAEAEAAARNFVKLMNRNTKGHFGFVAFHSDVGQDDSTTFHESNVGYNYPAGGEADFALPAISLQQAQNTTNFNKVNDALGKVVPWGGTNIGGSVERAVRMFETGSRPDARRAIIVFTDGAPTSGQPLSSDPDENCRMAAQMAHDKGVAIYSVGLALEPGLLSRQHEILGDDVSTGMSYIAGNEGKFYQVTDASQLNSAFTAISRQLTQLVE